VLVDQRVLAVHWLMGVMVMHLFFLQSPQWVVVEEVVHYSLIQVGRAAQVVVDTMVVARERQVKVLMAVSELMVGLITVKVEVVAQVQ
jgi:hypothetical protein